MDKEIITLRRDPDKRITIKWNLEWRVLIENEFLITSS